MSAVTRPRGPLPARVYWTRRILVPSVALLLVLGIGKALGGGRDASPNKHFSQCTTLSAAPSALRLEYFRSLIDLSPVIAMAPQEFASLIGREVGRFSKMLDLEVLPFCDTATP